MIATEAEIRVMLGLASSITDEERAALALFHPEAEGKVVEFLGYDPEQSVREEIYPRHLHSGGTGRMSGVWDVNSAHTHARFETTITSAAETLQLQGLPVREVVEVRVDSDARHGDGTDAFGSGTEWVSGEDYWVEWDQTQAAGIGVSRSGMLFASGSWPLRPGSVRVRYRAGFSAEELRGRPSASNVAADGTVTTAGLNASPIKRAVILTVTKAMMTWSQLKKKASSGFTAGPLQSEKLGDYSYTLGGASGENLSGLVVALPAEAEDALEEFRHYGLMRL